jgi:predicted Rossmann-fold nucleotide-binding protein
MKIEIDTPAKVQAWLKNPTPAVFQGQDLLVPSAQLARAPLQGCVFLGCLMQPVLAQAAVAAHCLIVPRPGGLPFNPFQPTLYTPNDLYAGFRSADPDTYRTTPDWLIYESYIDPKTRLELPVDVDVLLFRRVHDASIAEALDDLLDLDLRKRSVAIMGGHDVPRNAQVYADVARLAQALTAGGYFIVTGGGPGLMEAANLGAYTAGFANKGTILEQALITLAAAPTYKDRKWLSAAFDAWKAMGKPADPQRSESLGVPTWFYGHEPANVFATQIAKYFENSIREEGLLAIALGGVVFAEGNAGTVQEIFQDACQNYYRTYAAVKSPMVLLGVDYWNPSTPVRHNAADRRKTAYPLLEKLATEKGFSDYLLLTDDLATVMPFLKSHPPV